MYAFMVVDPEKRQTMVNWIQDRTVAYGIRYGIVFTDDQKFSASVVPPTGGTAITIPRMLRVGLWRAPFRMGWGGFRKFLRVTSQTEDIHKRHMAGPYYFELATGVDPAAHGKGVGSALIRAGTDMADEAGLACYTKRCSRRRWSGIRDSAIRPSKRSMCLRLA
jgi:GNAT superfamily N-acetyltransferase